MEKQTLPDASGWQTIGRFDVMARQDEVTRFLASLASVDAIAVDPLSGILPPTYPVSWLMRADIREAIGRIPHFAQGVCLHVAQDVVVLHPLMLDTPYRMNVAWRPLDAALRRFEVIARVVQDDGGELMHMISTLQTVTQATVDA